jgi:hypothetical protein
MAPRAPLNTALGRMIFRRALLLLLWVQATAIAGEVSMPADVQSYLDRREACDHWRGEYGYDKERQADIDWSICQTCPGSDAALALLKKKYRSNGAVMARLNTLEEQIELPDKAEAKAFCSRTRKPSWEK